MNSIDTNNDAGTGSLSALACLAEESARLRADAYWNCLTAARALSARFLAEGHAPWIARLRKTEVRNDGVFHFPLISRVPDVNASWTTHYVCCCDGMAYDPVAGYAIPLDAYCVEVFGEEFPMEVFVAADSLAAYLREHRPE